jgi:hypothetical protein
MCNLPLRPWGSMLMNSWNIRYNRVLPHLTRRSLGRQHSGGERHRTGPRTCVDIQTSSNSPLLTRRGGYRQRTFRDRERQRVQGLEAQLSALEIHAKSLASDNERLHHELLRAREENEALRGIAQPQSPRKTMQPVRRRTTMEADEMMYK